VKVRRNREQLLLIASVMLIVGVAGSPSFANQYSTVNWPGFDATEKTQEQILEDVYGGDFSGSGTDLGDGLWSVFSNGSVTARRVWDVDDADETIHIVTGDQTNIDQIWTDGAASVTAQARYAAHTQSFGWNGGGLGTGYVELLTHEDVGLGTVVPIEIAGDFLWGIQPNGDEWWSKNSINTDSGADHLVTYYIEGLITDKTVWLLFWEDLGSSGWDQDYNDFAVEVRAIPEPATIFLLGLGGLALLRKRTR
jgi:hypothetical protein